MHANEAIVELPLTDLCDHAANSNVMPQDLFEKLVAHIGDSGRYPPLIVRPVDANAAADADAADAKAADATTAPGAIVRRPRHQILDGHHRARALRRLGHATARCVVWDADDTQALVLLATLNRLEGRDDPRKRGQLIDRLVAGRGIDASVLAARLPESEETLRKLRCLASPAPPPRPPRRLDEMPVAVHFFLLPDQRRRLDARLRSLGGSRESALMRLVAAETPPEPGDDAWIVKRC